MSPLKYSLLLISLIASTINCGAIGSHELRWHDESADKALIQNILNDASITSLRSKGAIVEAVGKRFVDTPYVAATLEDSTEILTINTAQLDCTTYVELVAAIAKAIADGDTHGWNAVAENLRSLRYRSGQVDGYSSRLHYITDWILNNSFRGNITDVTSSMPGARKVTKTLDFMSTNRDKYDALRDSATFAKIKDVEAGLRGVSYYVVPKSAVASKAFNAEILDGDIVFITTPLKNLDVVHAGIIVKDETGIPHLMHASSTSGKVIVDPTPLADYLRRNKMQDGLRVVRLK